MSDLHLDAEACARESIHLSGAIQPHGYLLSCSIGDWVVRHASANVEALFELPAQLLVGRDLREFITSDVLDPVASLVALLEPDAPPQRAGAANIGVAAQMCDVGVHVAGGLAHLELEPRAGGPRSTMPTVLAQAMIARANSGADMTGFFQRCADQVRELSGYDRVMVYRFRHDDTGEVLAESRDEAMEPYLGLRFPASDIPAQARALYVRNRIRVIPDVGYVAVPIVPATSASGAPLDLSQHALRSVSPVHLEYLRNMGVQASMSISILVGGRLWGLIACHHREPRQVPLPVRAALDMFGLFVSMRVGSHGLERAAEAEESTREVREALAMRIGSAPDIAHAMCDAIGTLSRTIASDGVALRCDGAWHAHGDVPAIPVLAHALEWAKTQAHTLSSDWIPSSDEAAEWAPVAADGVAGVLAIPFGRRGDWILFFRREQVEQVRWAGDPNKPMVPTDDGVRIAPRRSFASWRETVRGHALPWDDGDLRAAGQLRRLLQEYLWQPLPEESGNVTDMDVFRRRHVLHEQKSRLDQLGDLLNGLGHLGDAHTARIGERIAALEAEIRALMLDKPSEQA
jgi:light-regulated signal transduction histidine kinase (bacteriophytochrome)